MKVNLEDYHVYSWPRNVLSKVSCQRSEVIWGTTLTLGYCEFLHLNCRYNKMTTVQ